MSLIHTTIFFDIFSFFTLFRFVNEAKLANFADDNTLCVGCKELTSVLDILQRKFECAIN